MLRLAVLFSLLASSPSWAAPVRDFPDRIGADWVVRRVPVDLPSAVERYNAAFRQRRYRECLRIARWALKDHPNRPVCEVMLLKAESAIAITTD